MHVVSEKKLFFFFFLELTNVIQNQHFDDLVLCGDFNCVVNNDSDIISGENHARGTVTKFNDVLNECNLFDI